MWFLIFIIHSCCYPSFLISIWFCIWSSVCLTWWNNCQLLGNFSTNGFSPDFYLFYTLHLNLWVYLFPYAMFTCYHCQPYSLIALGIHVKRSAKRHPNLYVSEYTHSWIFISWWWWWVRRSNTNYIFRLFYIQYAYLSTLALGIYCIGVFIRLNLFVRKWLIYDYIYILKVLLIQRNYNFWKYWTAIVMCHLETT